MSSANVLPVSLLPAAAADAQSVHVTNANTWNVAGCAQVLACTRPRQRPRPRHEQQAACEPINAALPGSLQLQCQWQWELFRTDRYMAINQTTLSLDFQPSRRCEKFYDSFAFAVQFQQNLHPGGDWGALQCALCVPYPGSVTSLSCCGKLPTCWEVKISKRKFWFSLYNILLFFIVQFGDFFLEQVFYDL